MKSEEGAAEMSHSLDIKGKRAALKKTGAKTRKKTYKTLIMIVVLRTVNIILLKCLTNKFAVPLSK